MNERELRIGTLIEYNGFICTVSSINSPKPLKDIRYSNKWLIEVSCGGLIDVCLSDIVPIPITEQSLIGIGATKNEDCDNVDTYSFLSIYNIGKITIAQLQENVWCFIEEQVYDDENLYLASISAPMSYIHTLQNYYPAFTGEELPVRSPLNV